MANEPKWTPGPWSAQMGHSDWGMPCSHIIVKDGDTGNSVDEWIAEIHSETPYAAGATRRQREHSAKQIANAHLIAAAPDMAGTLEIAPIPSKYHGQNGFDVERFLAAYDDFLGMRRAALAKVRGE